jgi:hypothetical protein
MQHTYIHKAYIHTCIRNKTSSTHDSDPSSLTSPRSSHPRRASILRASSSGSFNATKTGSTGGAQQSNQSSQGNKGITAAASDHGSKQADVKSPKSNNNTGVAPEVSRRASLNLSSAQPPELSRRASLNLSSGKNADASVTKASKSTKNGVSPSKGPESVRSKLFGSLNPDMNGRRNSSGGAVKQMYEAIMAERDAAA